MATKEEVSQTLPSCDHSASNRLIQAYIDKKNLSTVLGGCGSAEDYYYEDDEYEDDE